MPTARYAPNTMPLFEQLRQEPFQIEDSVKLNGLNLPVSTVLQGISRYPLFQTFKVIDSLNDKLVITGLDEEDRSFDSGVGKLNENAFPLLFCSE